MSPQAPPPAGAHANHVPWRGMVVVVTWICWPLMYFTVETVVRMSLSTTRGCSIEGCDTLTGWPLLLSASVMLIVPVAVTRWWWKWRRLRHAGVRPHE